MQLYAAWREVEIRWKEWTINDSAWGHDQKDIKFGHVVGRGPARGEGTDVCSSNNRYHKTKLCFFFSHRQANLDSTFSIAHSPASLSDVPWHMKKRGRNKLSEISNCSPRTMNLLCDSRVQVRADGS